ncbi:hypothetical protein [Photobacterium atrarenae]|uniref:Uncharacterized protein n=1 Tax=Photobacterium atrarenae TaxID=865757 RepID=A0ABY5GJC6_9GAMM|nr:hypothetical protein [Photobacterium atrarenae]UTV28870.1 hypothetical protein NNL38_06460 [Photobacterium atrarenae]
MSFSDYLDDFIRQRDKQGQNSTTRPRFDNRQPTIAPTNQSVAREALAKAQENAAQQAAIETKDRHIRINGRCVTEREAQAVEQLKVAAKPVNPARVDYIQQLRKSLKLKKRTS